MLPPHLGNTQTIITKNSLLKSIYQFESEIATHKKFDSLRIIHFNIKTNSYPKSLTHLYFTYIKGTLKIQFLQQDLQSKDEMIKSIINKEPLF